MRIFLASLLLLLPVAADENWLTASAIPEGATLKVEYTSSGCFHHERARFEFRNGSVKVWKYVPKEDQEKIEWEAKLIGEKKLVKAEIEGLDLLFAYYQAGNRGGCTTVDRIGMTLVEGKRVLREENHVDATCHADDRPGVLTLDELLSHVEEGALANPKPAAAGD
ncbi:hypothetical protein [Haloferula helveola]